MRIAESLKLARPVVAKTSFPRTSLSMSLPGLSIHSHIRSRLFLQNKDCFVTCVISKLNYLYSAIFKNAHALALHKIHNNCLTEMAKRNLDKI